MSQWGGCGVMGVRCVYCITIMDSEIGQYSSLIHAEETDSERVRKSVVCTEPQKKIL